MPQDPIGTEKVPACYVCGNPGRLLYRDCVDHLFGTPGTWAIRKCNNTDCGIVWLDPRPVADEIGKVYRNYYTHGSNHTRRTCSARIVRAILHSINTGLLGLNKERRRYKRMYLDRTLPGRLLEVGCGNGKRLARMQALGWEVMGQEIDPVAAEYVRKEKGIPVHLGSLETISAVEKYDVVIMSHVIEHVHDPVALLKTCHGLLKEKGLLVVLTPNIASYGHRKFGATWRGLEPPRHLHLFTSKILIRLSQKAGFSHQDSWTTMIGAFGIGESSLSSTETVKEEHRFITTRDVLRGFWFQFVARLIFLVDKNSGEECVLIATK